MVATDAGIRHVAFEPDPVGGPDTIRASSTMGVAKVALRVGGPATRTADVDLGNPHLVVLDDVAGERVDVVALGRANPDVNVEVIRSVDEDIVTMEVWERGVGHTEACGTGACAAAIAAAEWGLTELPVTVRMPGGDVEVSLGDEVTLAGPATWIADVEVMP
jgi:diaminopimelate epimerase